MTAVDQLREAEVLLAQYKTLGGAVVMVVGADGEEHVLRTTWRCCGCGTESEHGWSKDTALHWANDHARKCRSMPLPKPAAELEEPRVGELTAALDQIRHELAQRPDQLAARDLTETVQELVGVVRDGLDNVADQVHTLAEHVEGGQAAIVRELDAGRPRWSFRKQYVFVASSSVGSREVGMPEVAARIVCWVSRGRLDYWPTRQPAPLQITEPGEQVAE